MNKVLSYVYVYIYVRLLKKSFTLACSVEVALILHSYININCTYISEYITYTRTQIKQYARKCTRIHNYDINVYTTLISCHTYLYRLIFKSIKSITVLNPVWVRCDQCIKITYSWLFKIILLLSTTFSVQYLCPHVGLTKQYHNIDFSSQHNTHTRIYRRTHL